MAHRVNRGEVWLYSFRAPDKRRPVVILSRQDVIPLLQTVIVAPVTSTIRGLRSEVPVGPSEGLKGPSAVNLDHVQIVEQDRLGHFLGRLDEEKMSAVCAALAIAVGCGS